MSGEGRHPRFETSWEWLAFAAGLPAEPIPFTGVAANTLIASGRFIVTGFTTSNASTSAQTFNLRDGLDNTGKVIVEFSPNASAKQVVSLPSRGLLVEIGIWAECGGGPISGAVYAIPLWHYPLTVPGT